jgi:hypothetical protein
MHAPGGAPIGAAVWLVDVSTDPLGVTKKKKKKNLNNNGDL